MVRRSTRHKIRRTVPVPSIKNSDSAKKITKNVKSKEKYCEIIFEGKQKSTLSAQKPKILEKLLKSKELSDRKLPYSTVHRTPVIQSADKKGAKNVDKPSPQVMPDPQGYVVLDERSTSEPEVDMVYENTKKRKTQQWTLKDTKKFYASLGTVQTDFSAMSHLFGNSRSRHELKLKFKLEEKRNKDLVDKALSQRCNVDALLNEKCSGSAPVDQDSSVKKLNKTSSTENKTTAQNAASGQKAHKPRAKGIRRVRRFYFATSSDEDDVEVISSSSVQPTALTVSSQPPLPKPAELLTFEIKNGVSQPELHNFTFEKLTCALDNASINGLNISRPTVMRTGEKGKKQAFDARVTVNAEEDVVPLVNLEDTPETRPEVSHVPSDSVLFFSALEQELLKSTQKNRTRRKTRIKRGKSSVSSSYQNNYEAFVKNYKRQKVSKRNCYHKANGELDVVKLLLGDLEDTSLINPGNEAFLLSLSENNVLNVRRSIRLQRSTGSRIPSEEPDVEVLFEGIVHTHSRTQGSCK